MDISEFAPVGAEGSLRGPVTPAAREYTAAFVHTPGSVTHPDLIWSPRGSEIGPPQRPLTQPAQFYQPGGSIEHEPVNKAERASQATAQTIADHAAGIRAALRPGTF
jgi:hypothetical protein